MTHVGVFQQDRVHITAVESVEEPQSGAHSQHSVFFPLAVLRRSAQAPVTSLKQLPSVVEHDDGDIGRAQHAQLVSFFEEAVFALEERDGAIAVVCNRGDGDFSATHGVE